MFNLHRILSIAFFIVFFILPISANTVLEVTENDFVVGDKNAPVTIIEYASLSSVTAPISTIIPLMI